MILTPTPLAGAFVIEPEPLSDARGLFARTWCHRELEARGLETRIAQCSTSFNTRKGTLRGMHYQAAPFAETKLVRCTRGSIHDAIIDLRPDSPTFTRSFTAVLTADNRKAMYVPAGFAHGFQTLEDDTEVFYQISQFYSAEHSRGVRWNDPAFQISWPTNDPTISERDRSYPDFEP
ncbi:MAG: dTDP-4-dehydrorhamnose 3,5-epimerase, partial [Gemmatimonadales bacterium]